MKNNSNKRKKKVRKMRAEYDFSRGVRGKHADAYQQGHTVTVHKKDATTNQMFVSIFLTRNP